MKTYLKLALLLAVSLAFFGWRAIAEDASIEDAQEYAIPEVAADTAQVVHVDRNPHNILLFGDSMVLYMNKRLGDYSAGNGHDWHTVVWVSSTIKQWAETDTLSHFLRKYDPDVVLISLGSNEQFIKDPGSRDVYIKKLLRSIGDRHFAWICPPSWKKDTGINDIILSNVGQKRFFDSRSLELERGKDHIHPNGAGSAVWMDAIAAWLRDSTATAFPIKMDVTDTSVPAGKHAVYLEPLR